MSGADLAGVLGNAQPDRRGSHSNEPFLEPFLVKHSDWYRRHMTREGRKEIRLERQGPIYHGTPVVLPEPASEPEPEPESAPEPEQQQDQEQQQQPTPTEPEPAPATGLNAADADDHAARKGSTDAGEEKKRRGSVAKGLKRAFGYNGSK